MIDKELRPLKCRRSTCKSIKKKKKAGRALEKEKQKK